MQATPRMASWACDHVRFGQLAEQIEHSAWVAQA